MLAGCKDRPYRGAMITSRLTSKAQTAIRSGRSASGTGRPIPRRMPDFEIWDVVRVPSPYTTRPVQQRQPALVIAVPASPGAPDLLWVLMVTSAANRGWPGDVVVSDLAAAGLPAASVMRPAKVATIEAGDAERIGRLPTDDQCQAIRAVRDALVRLLAN